MISGVINIDSPYHVCSVINMKNLEKLISQKGSKVKITRARARQFMDPAPGRTHTCILQRGVSWSTHLSKIKLVFSCQT